MNVEQLANLLNQTWSQSRSARFNRTNPSAARNRPKDVWDIL